LRGIINSFANVSDTLTSPILMVIATPVFITHLGMDGYGVWALINSLIMALSFLNIGGGEALIKYVSYFRGKKDYQSEGCVFSTLFLCQIFALLLCLVVFLILKNFFENDLVVTQGVDIAVLFFGVRLLDQYLLSYYKAIERFEIYASISMFFKIVVVFIQVFFVWNGFGLVEVFWVALISASTSVMLNLFILKVKFQQVFQISNVQLSMLKYMFQFLKWSWLGSIVGVISTHADRWLLGILASSDVIGRYSLVLLVFNNLHMILAASVAWIFPRASKYEVGKKLDGIFVDLHSLMVFFSMFIALFLIVFDDVFKVWLTLEVFEASSDLLKMSISMLTVYAFGIVPYYLLRAQGYIDYTFKINLMVGILRVLLMLCLFEYFGVEGMVYSLAISGVVLSFFLFYRSRDVVDYSKKSFLLVVILSVFSVVFIGYAEVIFACLLFIFLFKNISVFKRVFRLIQI
jgi:O-antigen/teichoic acid export membrane protein